MVDPKPIDLMTKQELDAALDEIAPKLGTILKSYFPDCPGFVLLLGTSDYRGMICHIGEKTKVTDMIRRAADVIEAGQQDW